MLVTVAHPDDETFGCGSLLAHAAARGVDVTVLCATHGEAGSPAPGRGFDDADLGEVRARELAAAAELLGVSALVLLDWFDSGMDGDPAPGALAAAPLDAVVADVVQMIDRYRPHVVVTLDGSDGHRDHLRMREATERAVECASWTVDRLYLHCLPQLLMRRWVEELQAKKPDAAHLALGELGTPESEVTTIIDTTDLLDLRERAIATHESQVSPYEVMGPELRRQFLTAERLRRIKPPWTGGEIERSLFDG